MPLNKLLRRIHLYFGLALLPWFLLYGVSSIVFSHDAWFEKRDQAKGEPLWIKRLERPYTLAAGEGADLRAIGTQIVTDLGLQGSFGTYRQSADQLNVYVYTFWKSTQVKYMIAQQKLIVEERRFRWDHFLSGVHAQGGFEQGGWRNAWGAVVDIVCLGMLLWVATGLYMWWQARVLRGWGWLALAGGWAAFGAFLITL